jgi:hypothetical protein
MEEADAMKITGHTTDHVFRLHIGDVEKLRDRSPEPAAEALHGLGDSDPRPRMIFSRTAATRPTLAESRPRR